MKKERITKTIRNNAILRSIMPHVLRYLNPNYSHCSKCGLPWNWCRSKAVMYNSTSGTFATCDYCWDNSTLEELRQYYIKVYKMQERSLEDIEFGEFSMNHTLEHLLECVEAEYYKTK